MKKVFMVFALIGMLGSIAFAGPFFGYDHAFPGNDGKVYFGVQAGPLTLKLSVTNLGTISPDIVGEGICKERFGPTDLEYSAWVDLDPFTTWPEIQANNLGSKIKGTLHVGSLLESTFTLNLYAFLQLDYIPPVLDPSAGFGFYWEL